MFTESVHWRRKRDSAGIEPLLLEELDREVDRQRADVGRRSESVSTRAAVLVAAASLITSLQAENGGLSFSVAVLFTVFSAVLGVAVLLMRSGEQLNIESNETALWSATVSDGRRDLLYQKLYVLRSDEKLLRERAVLLNTGFGFLAASLVAAALHLTGAQ